VTKAHVIYRIRNVVNQKFYVGSTTGIRERFRTHRKRLRNNRHHCQHLQAAWNKYGEDCFKFEVLEVLVDEVDLQAVEDEWLNAFVGKNFCYNVGLRSGAPWRGVQKEQHPSFGRPKTDAEREAISSTLKEYYAQDITLHPRFGTHHTEETKAKIREAKLKNPQRFWEGKTRSEETRAKISAAQKGKPKGPRTYTPEGLERARENMRRNAKPQAPKPISEVTALFPPEVLSRYDFSNAVYTGALTRITGIKCPEHGGFSQYAAQLRKGRGCPLCGAQQRALSKKEQMKEYWATPEGRSKFLNSRGK
jgi:group I intron endonuclease